jgi:ATP-dependent 26S proteasome regulatory subunit
LTYSNYHFVCVLEDADGALMTRDLDNRREVGAILNITDGLLADFLKLQVICSINCSSTEIDPALIRPGRLSTHLLFERMPGWRAQRIAGDLGRELPFQNDYSLAEVFNTPATVLLNKPRIGFAA